MTTATRPRDPFRSPVAEAMRAQARRAVDAGPAEPELSAPVLRLACVVVVGAFAFSRWLALVQHPPAGAVFRAMLVAGAAGVTLILAGRASSAARRAALTAATLVVAAALALLVAGVPLSDLDPRAWGTLASGLGDGLGALPGLTVPYRGEDAWARTILVLGGVLLLVLAAIVAVWPRRPSPGSRTTAIAALAVLYAVPAVELTDHHPWRAGAAFALGLAAVLYAERLSLRQAPLALAAVLSLVLAALILAPRLDGGQPVVDLQKLATTLDGQNALTFSWNHSYGPLSWPRKGRVVARVDARAGAYWKTETLEDFDGTAWVAAPPSGQPGPTDPTPVPAWRQQIAVTIGALRTQQFLGAGTTTYVWDAPRKPVAGTVGSFTSDSRPLVNGDSYRARVYYPRPSPRQLERAGTAYPTETRDRTLTIPLHGGGQVQVDFAGGLGSVAGIVDASPYARAYALARRLRARARTPYEFVRAVQRHLGQGYAYDESPPRTRYPLATFLFDDRRGYCQHFSGAMAMLLRMGGVPARVATGFSPGTPTSPSGEFVVRDLDAHSWVEVLFPGIGWVTFDPTPQVAPAASQISDPLAISTPSPAGDRPGADGRGPADRQSSGGGVTGGSSASGGGVSWATVALALAALIVLGAAAALAIALRVERRRHPPTAPELAELERALRRSGRDPRPPTTLRDLERLLGPDARAAGYLRAVRDTRYDETATVPTDRQRRGLRRALGDGLGWRGRVRALWALPPRLRMRRRALH
jgi:transglutaminase-like putative cysteine protease